MVNLIPSKELDQLAKTFRILDNYGSGMISLEDLRQALTEFDFITGKQDVEALFNKVNVSKKGFIYFSEFVQAAINKSEHFSTIDFKFAFTYYDSDGDGFISAEDFKEAKSRKGQICEF